MKYNLAKLMKNNLKANENLYKFADEDNQEEDKAPEEEFSITDKISGMIGADSNEESVNSAISLFEMVSDSMDEESRKSLQKTLIEEVFFHFNKPLEYLFSSALYPPSNLNDLMEEAFGFSLPENAEISYLEEEGVDHQGTLYFRLDSLHGDRELTFWYSFQIFSEQKVANSSFQLELSSHRPLELDYIGSDPNMFLPVPKTIGIDVFTAAGIHASELEGDLNIWIQGLPSELEMLLSEDEFDKRENEDPDLSLNMVDRPGRYITSRVSKKELEDIISNIINTFTEEEV